MPTAPLELCFNQSILSNAFCNNLALFSEGWEQSGLFEFYKAKLKYIKDREEAEKLKVQEFPPSRSRYDYKEENN